MSLTHEEKKLNTLAESEGYENELVAMLQSAALDTISPGICMNEGCDYTTEIETISSDGWCEKCQTNTVKSALVLYWLV